MSCNAAPRLTVHSFLEVGPGPHVGFTTRCDTSRLPPKAHGIENKHERKLASGVPWEIA